MPIFQIKNNKFNKIKEKSFNYERDLQKLVEKKNTVVIIEHNMDVIKSADFIIDLGPEGGEKGGRIVVEGSPEEIINDKKSYTAKYLKKYL